MAGKQHNQVRESQQGVRKAWETKRSRGNGVWGEVKLGSCFERCVGESGVSGVRECGKACEWVEVEGDGMR